MGGVYPVRIKRLITACGLITLATVAVMAASGDTDRELAKLKSENQELRERVRKLESAMAEIREMLASEQKPAAQTPVSVPATAAKQGEVAVRARTVKEKPAPPAVDLYGYVKLDMIYDSARTDVGNFARWVLPEGANSNDGQMNITANQTRFGLRLKGPDFAGGRTSGNVEMDFYSLAGGENKPHMRMRHAYMKLEWPDHDFSILAGQTWDVISPRLPDTINFSVDWWVGNIGFRRPQLRLTKGFGLGDGQRLVVEGALTRTIGHPTGFDPGDSGEDSTLPTTQGRVAYEVPFFSGKATVGAWGHWGREEYDLDSAGRHLIFHSWSMGTDVRLPLGSKAVLSGEFWRGSNLDAYVGGIGQGLNLDRAIAIRSIGGWASLAVNPWPRWHFHFGGSADDPVNRDLYAGARARNRSIFGNFLFDINDSVQVGLELSHWMTTYIAQPDGDSVRVQGAFIYRF